MYTTNGGAYHHQLRSRVGETALLGLRCGPLLLYFRSSELSLTARCGYRHSRPLRSTATRDRRDPAGHLTRVINPHQ
jgi:hypothetical protein